MTDYLKIIFATLFFSLPVYCVSAQDLPEKQNNTSAVPDKHTASDTEKQTENQDSAADFILPDRNSAEHKDPEIDLFEKNCSASLAFNGSPYEHASCVVIYDMLKIELTPKAEFTENIKNADMNSLAQGTCAMFRELEKIHTVGYTFYDLKKNIINQHTVQKSDCR